MENKYDPTIRISKKAPSILDRPLNKGRNECGKQQLNCHCHERFTSVHLLCSSPRLSNILKTEVTTVADLQTKLSDLGKSIGSRILDVLVLREKGHKRETRIINVLLLIKTNVWKSLFGKEADKLEQSNDDDKTYYIIEKEPLVNKFISRQKDKGGLNCAFFIAGIVEEILQGCNFPCTVTAHWHKGTTFMIQFDETVIARDKAFDAR